MQQAQRSLRIVQIADRYSVVGRGHQAPIHKLLAKLMAQGRGGVEVDFHRRPRGVTLAVCKADDPQHPQRILKYLFGMELGAESSITIDAMERMHRELCQAIEAGQPSRECRRLIEEYAAVAESLGMKDTAESWRHPIRILSKQKGPKAHRSR